jgi:hypothetical protein
MNKCPSLSWTECPQRKKKEKMNEEKEKERLIEPFSCPTWRRD